VDGRKPRKNTGRTSKYHHIYDVDNLRACYDSLEARSDRSGWRDQGGIRGEPRKRIFGTCQVGSSGWDTGPEPKRRSYIPKSGSEKGRPLGSVVLKTRSWKKRPDEPLSRSTRPYSKTSQLRVPTGTHVRTCVWMLGPGDPAEEGHLRSRG